MCGIAGFFAVSDTARATIDARETLGRMIATLEHRGPDGFGYHTTGRVGLAHARLAIIDLTTGEQPMSNEDGTVWVTFNGEIFNYVELREELLRRGHEFRTQSDTEVIVHLYEDHGDRFVEHLNGQFAIALWDQRRQRLVLARDRVGIRPLYYARADGCVWFASEVKALLTAVPGLRQLDMRGLAQAFTLWSPIEGDTLFAGVESLPPGTCLTVDGDGTERSTRYWDWDFPSEPIRPQCSSDEAAEALHALLVDAVRLQLRADVPVGAYLSGGLDSSGLVSLIRNFTSSPIRTFSVSFDDQEFDESEHQREVVRYLGTEHTSLRCRRADIGAAFPRLIRHTETPVFRTAPVPLMLLSQSVRQHGYKVVLTGEGADEVFAGYDLFKAAKLRRYWAARPDARARRALLQRLYPYLKTSPVANRALSEQFFGQGGDAIDRPVFGHLPRWRSSARAMALLSPDARAQLGSCDPIRDLERQLPARMSGWSGLARDQYVEAHTLLSGYLLSSQGDRVAMASSIEGRVPYLDHRIIEFAAGLPPRFMIQGLREKHILRKALAGLIPDSVLKRVKQPYRAPDSQSFFENGEPLDYVDDLLSPRRLREAGYFDAAIVERLMAKCRAGRARGFSDNHAFVGALSVMMLDHWFVRGAAIADPTMTSDAQHAIAVAQ